MAIYQALVPYQDRRMMFLEWGSGLGVVSIMADRMGFAAYGIESESELIGHAEKLAEKFGPAAQFAHGSFIPDEFEWDFSAGDEAERTNVDVPAAYDQLSMGLSDFDLIYAYPWPGEHGLFRNIVRQFGREDTLLLTYDVREGTEWSRFDRR